MAEIIDYFDSMSINLNIKPVSLNIPPYIYYSQIINEGI